MSSSKDSTPASGPPPGDPRSAADAEDRRRIAGYLAGDAKAFREIESWILAELRARYPTLRAEDEDVAQVVHHKLLTNLRNDRFHRRSSLRTYVVGIVHHSAIDRLRERYRARALDERVSAEPAVVAADPYDAAEASEERQLLHRAMLRSSAACLELWRMVFVERLSYQAIASRLRIPPGTVKSRMWHCRKKALAQLQRLRRSRGPR